MGKGDFALPPHTLQKSGYDVKGTNGRSGGGGETLLTHTLIPPYDNNTNHITHVNKTSTQPYKFLVWYIL